MKDTLMKYILAFVLIGFGIFSYLFIEKSLGQFFLLLFFLYVIFISTKKGSLKRISLKELSVDFYNIEEKSLLLKSSDWLQHQLNIRKIKLEQIPIYMGMNLEEVELTSPFDINHKKTITTLNDFKKYKLLGYYPATTIDIVVAKKYEILLLLFDLLKKAVSFSKSTLSIQNIIPNLPAINLMELEPYSETYKYENKTIQEFLSNKNVKIEANNKKYNIKLEYDDNHSEFFSFAEVLRADFFNSGCEEILIVKYYHSAGTFQTKEAILIRVIERGIYQVINLKNKLNIITHIINFISNSKYMKPFKKVISLCMYANMGKK